MSALIAPNGCDRLCHNTNANVQANDTKMKGMRRIHTDIKAPSNNKRAVISSVTKNASWCQFIGPYDVYSEFFAD